MISFGPKAPENFGYDYHGDYGRHVLANNIFSGNTTSGDVTHTTRPITTGATVVGIRYSDGVMLMLDTAVSYGSSLRYKSVDRFKTVGDMAVVASSGEYSDFQFLSQEIEALEVDDWVQEDNFKREAPALASWLATKLYRSRSKMNPYWTQLLIAGYLRSTKRPYLGYVDLYGTIFQEDYIASGMGSYMALPMLRRHFKPDMSEDEAKQLLEACMRTLFYRDCNSYNRVQLAKATSTGIVVQEPYTLSHKWDYKLWQVPTSQLAANSGW